MSTVFRMTFIVLLLSLGLNAALKASEFAQADALKNVIIDQIRAFQSGDNQRAYSHAAPSIKRLFPNVDLFTRMVKNGYSPVYNPASLDFGPSGKTSRGPAQSVFVKGPDGVDYEAVYFFEETAAGWKINAVQIRKSDTPML